ncbi:SWIM zinc finger family protein [Streptomyces sp. H27-D2]|uniref:SWIM zinc finger family protein n=1 Tax=Streptomyces sp. H27-D2 TaxID=3046304 RepID=UPI002DBA3FED|nr:SWIM zinc finger family protein [Streptomyces sp. H27-D2]MEC4016527.1 SWIM zinc finger family protein [Streptomyces sp. H27-D2]
MSTDQDVPRGEEPGEDRSEGDGPDARTRERTGGARASDQARAGIVRGRPGRRGRRSGTDGARTGERPGGARTGAERADGAGSGEARAAAPADEPRTAERPRAAASDGATSIGAATGDGAARARTRDAAGAARTREGTTGARTRAPAGTAATRPPADAARTADRRRTFPALEPIAGRGERLTESWWGDAWVAALEEMSLDAGRLNRGRTYARAGHVDAITVEAGRIIAYVHGSRPRPYRTQIRLRTLTDEEWDRFLDAAAAQPGHIAALLDKDMPHSLVEAAAEAGVSLLPAAGDLAPDCSCPDDGHPCKHAAALCYQCARLLDTDPFVLLLMRGRGERELLDELDRRNAVQSARERQSAAVLPGVNAREALAPRTLPPLPAPMPPAPHPGRPPAYPGGGAGAPDPLALDLLATDATARAHTLLTTGADPLAGLTRWQDAVRLAAAHPGSGLTAATRDLYASLAKSNDRTPHGLARAAAAWLQGGAAGLAVLETPWDPPAGNFDRARSALAAADRPPMAIWRNRLTNPSGVIQLRYGQDGFWYPYRSDRGRDDWWPEGEADQDPVGALTSTLHG